MLIETILTPADIALLANRDLRGCACVVFDVLRATSTLTAALVNGASAVYPVCTISEALAFRHDQAPAALLGGERAGVRIDGFDLGNSPREYTAQAIAGRAVVTTTTNGTIALRACDGADAVAAAALVNVDAAVAWLLALNPAPARVLLVCAGTEDLFALEDGLGAGAVAARLEKDSEVRFDDGTQAMRAVYAQHHRDLASALRSSENGQRLQERGLGDDIAWCARENGETVLGVRSGAGFVAWQTAKT